MDPHILHRHVNHDVQILSDWCKASQLSVNPSKTKYILFSRAGGRTAHDRSIYINDEKIEQEHTTKFIGLYIYMSNFHVNITLNVARTKSQKGPYAIHSSKHILSQRHLKILYHCLIHPHLLYGIRIWGQCKPHIYIYVD